MLRYIKSDGKFLPSTKYERDSLVQELKFFGLEYKDIESMPIPVQKQQAPK